MAKNSVKVSEKKPNLRVVRETTAYNDIKLKDWRNYKHIETGTLWNFASRDNTNGHSYDYHGNYIPQIIKYATGEDLVEYSINGTKRTEESTEETIHKDCHNNEENHCSKFPSE